MRIDLMMTLRIMILDMRELSRILKSRHVPVQIPDPLVDGGVAAADVADVCLEVLNVDRVEADDGGVEADVGFGDAVAVVVGAGVLLEVAFDAVKGFEELFYCFFVGFL